MMHGNRLAALAASGKRKMLMTVPWISFALGPWVRRISFETFGTFVFASWDWNRII